MLVENLNLCISFNKCANEDGTYSDGGPILHSMCSPQKGVLHRRISKTNESEVGVLVVAPEDVEGGDHVVGEINVSCSLLEDMID